MQERDITKTLEQLGVTRHPVPGHIHGRCGFVTHHENGVASGWCGREAVVIHRRLDPTLRHGRLCEEHAEIMQDIAQGTYERIED